MNDRPYSGTEPFAPQRAEGRAQGQAKSEGLGLRRVPGLTLRSIAAVLWRSFGSTFATRSICSD
jgi:hypothetical protein